MSENDSNKVEVPSYIKNNITVVRIVSLFLLISSFYFVTLNINRLAAEENSKHKLLEYSINSGRTVYGIFQISSVDIQNSNGPCLGYLETELVENKKEHRVKINAVLPFELNENSNKGNEQVSSTLKLLANFTELNSLKNLDFEVRNKINQINIKTSKDNSNDFEISTTKNNITKSSQMSSKGITILKKEKNSDNSYKIYPAKEQLKYSKILKESFSKNNLILKELKDTKLLENYTKSCSHISKSKHLNNIDNSGILLITEKLQSINT